VETGKAARPTGAPLAKVCCATTVVARRLSKAIAVSPSGAVPRLAALVTAPALTARMKSGSFVKLGR